MNTRTSIVMTAAAALFLAGLVGCQSWKSPSASTASPPPPGPASGAALLSSKKTFDIIGRSSKSSTTTTDSLPTDPSSEATSQAVRSTLEAHGYQFDSNSPDFRVSIAWNDYKEAQPPTPSSPPPGMPANTPNVVLRAKLSIVARDTPSGVILWQSPLSETIDPKTVTDDQARTLAQKVLADFPPQSGK